MDEGLALPEASILKTKCARVGTVAYKTTIPIICTRKLLQGDIFETFPKLPSPKTPSSVGRHALLLGSVYFVINVAIK